VKNTDPYGLRDIVVDPEFVPDFEELLKKTTSMQIIQKIFDMNDSYPLYIEAIYDSIDKKECDARSPQAERIEINPYYNPGLLTEKGGAEVPPLKIILGHELAHIIAQAAYPKLPSRATEIEVNRARNYWEMVNIVEPWENKIRNEFKLPKRLAYPPVHRHEPDCTCK